APAVTVPELVMPPEKFETPAPELVAPTRMPAALLLEMNPALAMPPPNEPTPSSLIAAADCAGIFPLVELLMPVRNVSMCETTIAPRLVLPAMRPELAMPPANVEAKCAPPVPVPT